MNRSVDNSEIINTVIVDTKLGKIQGRITKSDVNATINSEYYSFQGIRYAKPPLGSLRFRAPQPTGPWDGILDATQEGNPCPSMGHDGTISGDEDCLFLNIYTPVIPDTSNELLPVMFWIHGGGFYAGSGTKNLYSPDHLMPQNVILVTINYRLGVFGFIICDDPKLRVPGNAGCKDVIMALKWVQNHIQSFSGDPNNVTVWGQSAGAIIAQLLLISPMAKGLFHRAILQSGIYFGDFNSRKREPFLAIKLLTTCGFSLKNEEEALNMLTSMTTEEIITHFNTYRRTLAKVNSGFTVLTIENSSSLEEAFTDHDIEHYYLKKKINDVPIIVGTNSVDGMIFASKIQGYGAMQPELISAENVVPALISRNYPKYLDIGKKIINFYYGREEPSRRNLDKYSRLLSDTEFNLSAKRFIQFYQRATNQPVYRYRFTFESPHNLYKKLYNLQLPGVCHGDELTYLFKSKYSRKFKPGSIEELTQYRMIKLWTNFAKTGNPNPAHPSSVINANWLPVQPGQLNHLNIGKCLTYKNIDREEYTRFKFWDDLFKSYFEDFIECMTNNEQLREEFIKNNTYFQMKFLNEYQEAKISI